MRFGGAYSRQNLPRSPVQPLSSGQPHCPHPGPPCAPQPHPPPGTLAHAPSAAAHPRARPLGPGPSEDALQSCPLGKPPRAPHGTMRWARPTPPVATPTLRPEGRRVDINKARGAPLATLPPPALISTAHFLKLVFGPPLAYHEFARVSTNFTMSSLVGCQFVQDRGFVSLFFFVLFYFAHIYQRSCFSARVAPLTRRATLTLQPQRRHNAGMISLLVGTPSLCCNASASACALRTLSLRQKMFDAWRKAFACARMQPLPCKRAPCTRTLHTHVMHTRALLAWYELSCAAVRGHRDAIRVPSDGIETSPPSTPNAQTIAGYTLDT